MSRAYKCDRCGAVLTGSGMPDIWLHLAESGVKSGNVGLRLAPTATYDLCPPCFGHVLEAAAVKVAAQVRKQAAAAAEEKA